MSADGYFRLPRRLFRAPITQERQLAIAWLVSEASFAERDVAGVRLSIGETPPISLTGMEERFRWSRKSVRVFLEYLLSPRCASETGVRVSLGQKVKGHTEGHRQGHSEGHSGGHTYIVRLVKLTTATGHREGHSEGHPLGHGDQKEGTEEGDKFPPSGETTRVAARGVRRKLKVPTLMTTDWMPSEQNVAWVAHLTLNMSLLLPDFRQYWIDQGVKRADWDRTFRNRANACASQGTFLLNGRSNGNGRNGTGRPDRDRWRYRPEGVSVADGDASIVPDDFGDE